MCPEASKPVRVPAVNKLEVFQMINCSLKLKSTYKDKSQFHPAGAPVPLSVTEVSMGKVTALAELNVHVIVKTSLADRKPYVFETPMGNQMRHKRKSSIIKPTENLKTPEYHFGGR
jgi:hypothetical protein